MKIRNCFVAFVLISVTIINSPLFAEDWLPDPNLRLAIRETLREEIGLHDHTPLTKEHLKHLANLEADNSGINDLTGLEYAVFLERFNADHNQIEDLQPLANLVNLTSLSLYNNRISDISPLANLTNLEDLYLSGNRISDISPLEKLTNLKVLHLHLGGNQVSNLLPLADLVELEQLALSANRISDISPLEKLTNLKTLHLGINQISDITPLINLTELVELSLNDNQIVDVTTLENLSNLVAVSLQGNPIRDVSPLLNLPALRYLNIEKTLVEDITPFLDLNLIEFRYDVLCKYVEFSIIPVEERISTRSFPSVFQMWNPIWIEGIPYWERLTDPELIPYHDLVVNDFITYPSYLDFNAKPHYGLSTHIVIDVERTQARYGYYHSRNPNFVNLLSWSFRVEKSEAFPDHSKYWMLDAEGKRIAGAGTDRFIINFLNPEVQEIIIEQAVGIASAVFLMVS